MTEPSPITRLHNAGKLSRVVCYQGVAYLSGLTAADKSTDTAGQARQIFARADALLAEAGTDRSRLLFAQIWLRDIGDFDAMNGAWMDWIDPLEPPARATVEAKFALPEIAIEIQFTAALSTPALSTPAQSTATLSTPAPSTAGL